MLKQVANIAPLVVVIDDLHLADTDSIQLLSFVARDFARSRILVLVTCRDEWSILPPERAAALGELAREAERIDLKGLTNDEVAEFVRKSTSIEPDQHLVSSLRSRTSGNPFFLDGLARLLTDGTALPDQLGKTGLPIPPTIVAAVERRLEPLSSVARRVLRLASVMEEEIDASILAHASGLSRPELTEAIEEAIGNGLLISVPDGRALRFNQGLVAESVRAGMTKGELRTLHGSVAQALEHLHGEDLEPHIAPTCFPFC